MRFELEQVLAIEGDRALGHFIAGAATQDIAEGRLAGAVGAHDRVDLARVHGEAKTLEDRLGVNLGVKVFNLEHGYSDKKQVLIGTADPDVTRAGAIIPPSLRG